MRTTTEPLPTVGRREELDAIAALVRDPRAHPTALVLDGEPGVGKTILWRAGLDAARGSGLACLARELVEGERDLPLVGLLDLVADHREVAQPIFELAASADPVDPASLGRALVQLVATLAERGPVLLAFDDVQWLDVTSARVVAFALRRVADLPVRVLVTNRSPDHATGTLGLDRAVPADGLARRTVVGLEPSELDELLRARLGVRMPRPRLLALHAAVAGNPFYAQELVQAALRAGHDPARDELHVPRRLSDVVRRGVADLSTAGRRSLLLAATAGEVPADVLESAGGREGLLEALAGGALELSRGLVRVRHPLLASVTYESALPSERREAHGALAGILGNTLEAARHRALCTPGTDAEVAADLEASAAVAARRGSPALAAFLAEHAARLSPIECPEADRRRRLAAAEYHVAAGDPSAARAVLEALVDEAEPGSERARALLLLADTVGADLKRSITLAELALAEAADLPALRAEVHTSLGVFTWLAGDLARAVDHTKASATAAAESGDQRLLAIALGEACHAEAVLGRPWSTSAMERALAIERQGEEFPPWLRPSFQLGIVLVYTDRLDEARPYLLAELERVAALGDEAARVGVLFRIAELELRAGNWTTAAHAADEAKQLGGQAGIEQEQATGIMVRALVRAHLGDLDAARTGASEALAQAEAMGDRIIALRARSILGFVEVSAGNPAAALAALEPAIDDLRAMGIGELSITAAHENAIEALVSLGRIDEAEALAHEVADRGLPAKRSWHAAVSARGLALVAAARGDVAAAFAALDAAYRAHDQLTNPFTRARTDLAHGLIARRARRWAEARAAFELALETFDRLGAARWAERSATELVRLPGRPSAGTRLTASEQAVADLAAAGLQNKEIAARLSVTVRTVEQHLTQVYEKLSVGSRTELARRRAAAERGVD